jgi:hypothetical protein
MGVPTPTGTLQGVAAFSWDGSAWQPSGRAGPAVGTPTGVLRGVAPFTWDGAAWQPSGRAGPGVATPTGVLDGVAVYTWSGSAWVPASGQPTPSTPSGALRGVAAFSWDGAAWQPAGQAGPTVATPYGALDGVAMFEWSGNIWMAGAAVPAGATLDLSFISGGSLDPRLTFTRASTATYFDATGTMQTATTNVPRFDYDPVTHALRGLLIEEQRVNQLFPSVPDTTVWTGGASTVTIGASVAPDGTATATQVAETAANAMHYVIRSPMATTSLGPQTLSLYAKANGTRYLQVSLDDSGSGTIGGYATFDLQAGVVSGALTARGAAVIGTATIQAVGNGFYRCAITVTTTGAALSDRVMLILSNVAAPTFSPTYAGNAANSVLLWGVQIEISAFPTSYIATTAAAVTRALDDCWMAIGAWFNAAASTLFGEFIYPRQIDATEAHDLVVLGDNTGSAGNHITLRATDGGAGPLLSKVNTPTTTLAPPGNPVVGAVSKLVGALDGTTSYACLNGGAVGTLAAPIPTGLVRLILGNHNTGGTASPLDGYIRRVRYWPRVLSNAELQSVTT